MASRSGLICASSPGSSTPAVVAASKQLSSKMSHPPNTMSSSEASGTRSFMSGVRPSVRLPKRIVPICVSEPIGRAIPLRTAMTPAMNVVLTAPRPTSMMPSFPLGGAISDGEVTNGNYIMSQCLDLPRPPSPGYGETSP